MALLKNFYILYVTLFYKLYGQPNVYGQSICPFDVILNCDSFLKYSSLDGSCNNLKNPIYGSILMI